MSSLRRPSSAIAAVDAPQVLAQRQAGRADRRRHLPADVSVVPGLVVVAGHPEGALRVAHQPSVAPRVVAHPGARGTGCPVGVAPRNGATGVGEVDGRAELMLGVPWTGAAAQSR